jgi:4,5-dihydroxyphthalate decarboxylase
MSQNKATENDTDIASRRYFLKKTALAASAIGVTGGLAGCQPEPASGPAAVAAEPNKADGLPLKVTGYNFDRLAALADGEVEIEGCDTQFTLGKIGDMNTDVFSGPQSFDITEIGLHPFMLAYANEGFRDYSLLPIFPLRLFRHKSVFIRTDRGITNPEDLRGKTIASPGYSSTSLTWLRGLFQDEYGISPQDVQWVTAVMDSSTAVAGKVSAQESMVPDGVPMKFGTPGKDESDLLESGEVDALFHAAEPRAYTEGHPAVARLFADSRAVEQAYYKKTGIFPIMHAIAIRNASLEKNPWLAEAVFKAYSQSKTIAYQKMARAGWFMSALPWYGQELEETKALMGDNFYSYGLEPNRKSLEALFRYSFEQGLSGRQLSIEDLFVSSSLDWVES